MAFVVDNSVAMAWCFSDEVSPYADAVLDRVREAGAVAPVVWPLEAANGLVAAERRGRIKEADVQQLFQDLLDLKIEVDRESPTIWLDHVFALARQHGLTSYDASYLELAVRLGLPLATQDGELRDAAGRAGVPLVA